MNRAAEARRGRIELRTVALALIASLLLWMLPFGGVVLYPFKLLATWIHELSHGLAMIAFAGGLSEVDVYRDTSGVAIASGSAGAFGGAVIAAAGYMGTPLWGAALLVIARTARAARRALLVVAAALVVTAIFVVGNEFGQYAIAAIAVGVAAAAIALPPRWRLATAHFLAAQACVNALLDIRVLFRPSHYVDGVPIAASDATLMASRTFGTTDDWAVWTWGAIWMLWSLLVLFVALRAHDRGAGAAAGGAGAIDASSSAIASGASRTSDSGA